MEKQNPMKYEYKELVFNLPFGNWGGFIQLIQNLPNGDTILIKQYNTPVKKHSEECQDIIDKFIKDNPIIFAAIDK